MAMDDPHNFNHTLLSFLTKGSKVEVSSDEDGFDGAWFVATVIHPPPAISDQNHHTRNNLVYVEYHKLLTEDGASRLREYANVAYIRPSPDPDTSPPDFQLNDVVDAVHRDGWWTGVITTIVDTSNFIVTFPIKFNFTFLIYGYIENGPVANGSDRRISAKGNNSYLVEYEQPGNGDEPILHKVTVDYLHIRPSPPHLKYKNFVLLEKVDAYGWWSGVITKELADNRYNVFKHTKNENEFVCSHLRPHIEWKGGKWFNTSQSGTDERTVRPLIDEQIEETITPITNTVVTSIMKNTNSKKLKDDNVIMVDDSNEKTNRQTGGQSEGFDSEVSRVNDQAFGQTENLSHGKKVRSKRGKSIEQKSPTMVSSKKKGRYANELKSLQASGEGAKVESVKTRAQEIVEKVVIELQCNGMTVSQQKILEPKQSNEPLTVVIDKEGDVAQKRKRGRPPKLQAVSPNNPVAVEENEEAIKGQAEVAGKKHARKRKKASWSKVKRRTISINTESLAQDSQDASKEKPDGSLEKDSAPEASVKKSLDNMSDDQPLSTWFEGKQPPIAAQEDLEGSIEQSSGKRLEIVACKTDTFVRSTPLWQTIESMEAFRKLPQNPHFRPLLRGVKPSAREGLAIGCMVTFSTVVDRTRALKFDDERNAIEDCLETLVELESNGFDIKVIRERLTRLLLIKDKQEELEDRSKGVEVKIEEHKTRFDEEIEEIDRQIRVLEEKRRQLLTKMEKKNSETKAERETIEKAIEKVVAEFDELAAAPF